MQLVIPQQDMLLVRPHKEGAQLNSGLILTQKTVREVNAGKASKPFKGTVVAVGPGFIMPNGEVRPVEVPVGATVVFDYFDGQDHIDHEGEDVVMVKESAVKVML